MGRGPAVVRVDEDLHFVSEPGEAVAGEFVGLGVVIGQPAWSIDTVEDVVGDVEGEVEACAVVLDVAFDGEIGRIDDGGEGGDPAVDAFEGAGVGPLTGPEDAVELRRSAGEGVERTRIVSGPADGRHN